MCSTIILGYWGTCMSEDSKAIHIIIYIKKTKWLAITSTTTRTIPKKLRQSTSPRKTPAWNSEEFLLAAWLHLPYLPSSKLIAFTTPWGFSCHRVGLIDWQAWPLAPSETVVYFIYTTIIESYLSSMFIMLNVLPPPTTSKDLGTVMICWKNWFASPK